MIEHSFNNDRTRLRLRFEGSCLKQEDKAPFTLNHVVNSFIVYEFDTWSQDLIADFTLKDCLFGSVEITEIADPDKYSYSGCGIGFQSRSLFQFQILIGVKMSLFLEFM